MGFQTAPPEIQSVVFDLLAKSQHRETGTYFWIECPRPEYNVRRILNAMLTCTQLYAVGLPYLYHDVSIKTLPQAHSFFVAIHEYGRLVRRVRIEEPCRVRPMADTDKCSLCKRHDHVTARDRLVSLAKLCPNLKTLFVLCNCPFEDNYNPFALTGSKGTTFVSWLQEFVQLCPSLEVLVPPMECVTGRTVGISVLNCETV